MAQKDQRNEWLKTYLGSMVGSTIKSVGVSDDGYPFFVIEKGRESYTVEISQDEEGNGPGFLFGLPKPAVSARAARK